MELDLEWPNAKELGSAELDASRWWSRALKHPAHALFSPLFGILTLEDPGRWKQREDTSLQAWISWYVDYLENECEGWDQDELGLEIKHRALALVSVSDPWYSKAVEYLAWEREFVDMQRPTLEGHTEEEERLLAMPEDEWAAWIEEHPLPERSGEVVATEEPKGRFEEIQEIMALRKSEFREEGRTLRGREGTRFWALKTVFTIGCSHAAQLLVWASVGDADLRPEQDWSPAEKEAKQTTLRWIWERVLSYCQPHILKEFSCASQR